MKRGLGYALYNAFADDDDEDGRLGGAGYRDRATVAAVQAALKGLAAGLQAGDPRKSIYDLNVDGIFGDKTASAVLQLHVDGNQDPATDQIDDWTLSLLGVSKPSEQSSAGTSSGKSSGASKSGGGGGGGLLLGAAALLGVYAFRKKRKV